MAPKLTKNTLRYTRYLVSPNKVAILMRSDGRDFMFADRFSCEFLYIVTQKVDPRIEHERDLRKRLAMFTTHYECHARVHIMKSLSLLKGKVITSAKEEMQM